MTKLAFKGIHRPTQPDHTGLLIKSPSGRMFLMLWSYQKYDVEVNGWLVFMLNDDSVQPYIWNDRPYSTYIQDVDFQVIGIASSLPVVDPKPQRPVIRFIRTARKEI